MDPLMQMRVYSMINYLLFLLTPELIKVFLLYKIYKLIKNSRNSN